MRSALKSVKGVTRARVSLEDREAIVTYDPAVATVEDLLKAVSEANGMHPYSAIEKKKKKKGDATGL